MAEGRNEGCKTANEISARQDLGLRGVLQAVQLSVRRSAAHAQLRCDIVLLTGTCTIAASLHIFSGACTMEVERLSKNVDHIKT